jgi:hypothetical protein
VTVRSLRQDPAAAARPGVRRIVLAPSAPLVLPDASPGVAAEHRDDVGALLAAREAALARLDPTCTTIVLAVGAPPGVHDHARVDLRPLGVPVSVAERPVAAELLAPITAALQRPLLVGSPVGVDASVLVASTTSETPVVVVELPSVTEGEPLVALGVGLVAAAERVGAAVQLLVAGDLSTGLGTASPRYVLPDAHASQRRVVEALMAGDARALAAIGPDEAARTGLRSWAVLTVAAGAAAAAGLRAQDLEELEARGVGHVVGSLA